MSKKSFFTVASIKQWPHFEAYLFFFQAIGGNIATASPISDMNPLFMAAGVVLQLASKGQLMKNF